MLLSANFTLEEFERASHRALTAAERELASWWAREVLQPARDRFGPIRVSSYVRTRKPGTIQAETGAHKDGAGIDVVPLQATNRELADYLAAGPLAAGVVRQVITYEGGAHVHIARELVPGASPGYLSYDGTRYNYTAPEPLSEPLARRLWLGVGVGALLLLLAR